MRQNNFGMAEGKNWLKIVFNLGIMYWFSKEAAPATTRFSSPLLAAVLGDGALFSISQWILYLAGMKLCANYASEMSRLSQNSFSTEKLWWTKRLSALKQSASSQIAYYRSPMHALAQLAENAFSNRDYDAAIFYYRKIPNPGKLKNPVFSNSNIEIITMDELIQMERSNQISTNAINHLTPEERAFGRAQNRIDEATMLKIDLEFDSDSGAFTSHDEETLINIIQNNSNLSFDATLILAKCYIFEARLAESLKLLLPLKEKISTFLKIKISENDNPNLSERKTTELSNIIKEVAIKEYQPLNALLLLLVKVGEEKLDDSECKSAVRSALNALISCPIDEYHFIQSNFEIAKFQISQSEHPYIFSETVSQVKRLIDLITAHELHVNSQIANGIAEIILTYSRNDELENYCRAVTDLLDPILLRGSEETIKELIHVEAIIYARISGGKTFLPTYEYANRCREDRKFRESLKAYELALLKMEIQLENPQFLEDESIYLTAHYRCSEIILHLLQHDKKMAPNERTKILKEAENHLLPLEKAKNKTISQTSTKTFQELLQPLQERLFALSRPPINSQNKSFPK